MERNILFFNEFEISSNRSTFCDIFYSLKSSFDQMDTLLVVIDGINKDILIEVKCEILNKNNCSSFSKDKMRTFYLQFNN